MPRRRHALRGTQALNTKPTPYNVVGLAHVVMGAARVLNFLVFTLSTGASQVLSPASILLAVIAGVTVLGGLWLSDRRQRGAVVALSLDVASIAVLLLLPLPQAGTGLDLFINAALAVAVVWVMPRMEVEREAEARLTRIAADKPTGD